jgi:hypothetical protein
VHLLKQKSVGFGCGLLTVRKSTAVARDTSGGVAEDGVLSGESIEIAGAGAIELAGLDY